MPTILVDGLTFSSDFDSGNLAHVDKNGDEFFVWTSRDCAGTEFETSHSTWFHFSVAGLAKDRTINLCIKNMNKQPGLYSFDMRPVVRNGENGVWERCKTPVSYQNEAGGFELRFSYRCEVDPSYSIFFAFCYPYSFSDVQKKLSRLETVHQNARSGCGLFEVAVGSAVEQKEVDTRVATSARGREQLPSDIYFVRECLTHSLEGRRVDLLTVTSCEGMVAEKMPLISGLFPDIENMNDSSRPHRFPEKDSVFISSRVHPGETPSSYVFDGILDFLLRPAEKDPRAAELRRRYVFYFIPLLNPDGVFRGHYRADTRGVNLNRCYDNPSPEFHPSVYAAKALVVQLAEIARLRLYVDLHAHATKRGCFIFGNHLPSLEDQVSNQVFARLVAVNTPYLEYGACDFSEKNMKMVDKHAASKEGSGRVALYRATGVVHTYTLECNYNMGRELNSVSAADGDKSGRCSPERPKPSYVPKYTPAAWADVGKAVAVALLDLSAANPWSRLARSQWHTLEGCRQAVRSELRISGVYSAPRAALKDRDQKVTSKSIGAVTKQCVGAVVGAGAAGLEEAAPARKNSRPPRVNSSAVISAPAPLLPRRGRCKSPVTRGKDCYGSATAPVLSSSAPCSPAASTSRVQARTAEAVSVTVVTGSVTNRGIASAILGRRRRSCSGGPAGAAAANEGYSSLSAMSSPTTDVTQQNLRAALPQGGWSDRSTVISSASSVACIAANPALSGDDYDVASELVVRLSVERTSIALAPAAVDHTCIKNTELAITPADDRSTCFPPCNGGALCGGSGILAEPRGSIMASVGARAMVGLK